MCIFLRILIAFWSSVSFQPPKYPQKRVVSAANAESALENAAAIIPITNNT